MRVMVGEANSERFRISQQGVAVQDDQLEPVADLDKHVTTMQAAAESFVIEGYTSADGSDKYTYVITYDPFSIK